jgi:hypothetical protein
MTGESGQELCSGQQCNPIATPLGSRRSCSKPNMSRASCDSRWQRYDFPRGLTPRNALCGGTELPDRDREPGRPLLHLASRRAHEATRRKLCGTDGGLVPTPVGTAEQHGAWSADRSARRAPRLGTDHWACLGALRDGVRTREPPLRIPHESRPRPTSARDAARARPCPATRRGLHRRILCGALGISRNLNGNTRMVDPRAPRPFTPYGNCATSGRPRASGKPRETLSACTAWPDAPRVRLSITLKAMTHPVRASSA